MNAGEQLHLQIEDGIPVPAGIRGRAGNMRATVRALQVGQSVLISNHRIGSLGATIAAAKRATGGTYTARTVGADVRIWRTT